MAGAFNDNTSIVQKADSLLALIQGALSARNQAGWSRWLQGEIQAFLPHDVLIAAWGDFKGGVLAYDVITRSPSMSVGALPKHEMVPLMVSLFEKWMANRQEPLVADAKDLVLKDPSYLPVSRCVLVHGVQDHRSHYDCIYLFVGPRELSTAFSQQLCRMMLPFIDTGFRQLADRGQKGAQEDLCGNGFSNSSFADCLVDEPHRVPEDSTFGDPLWSEGAGERGSALSARELEIMEWVRMGKTNSEIAMILNLSTFTVKNHMRRIYKKLDVLNRAQAVGSLDRLQGMPQFAGR